MDAINNEQKPIKRPTGMTILLVLSFINACLNIFSNLIMYFGTPYLSELVKNGQFEATMEPFLASASAETRQALMDSMMMLSNIKPVYYLFMLVLFIVSLIGVLRMFKWNKTGFHLYSLSQILMLIASSVYKYPLQHPSPFTYDMLLTLMFILVYYLYFKRMEFQNQRNTPPNLPSE